MCVVGHGGVGGLWQSFKMLGSGVRRPLRDFDDKGGSASIVASTRASLLARDLLGDAIHGSVAGCPGAMSRRPLLPRTMGIWGSIVQALQSTTKFAMCFLFAVVAASTKWRALRSRVRDKGLTILRNKICVLDNVFIMCQTHKIPEHVEERLNIHNRSNSTKRVPMTPESRTRNCGVGQAGGLISASSGWHGHCMRITARENRKHRTLDASFRTRLYTCRSNVMCRSQAQRNSPQESSFCAMERDYIYTKELQANKQYLPQPTTHKR